MAKRASRSELKITNSPPPRRSYSNRHEQHVMCLLRHRWPISGQLSSTSSIHTPTPPPVSPLPSALAATHIHLSVRYPKRITRSLMVPAKPTLHFHALALAFTCCSLHAGRWLSALKPPRRHQ